MTSSWKPLNLSFSDPLLPLLLVKYDFGPSKYTVILTDLTYVWSETLDRKQIVKRALNVDTSIDPSESPDQLHLLLRNIQKPLDGDEGARLSLGKRQNSEQLNVQTTTKLPAPLKPLQWPFYLVPASQNLLTTELLLPCLSQQYVARAQIKSLLQQLKDKDHVINKLIERMQLDGSDFSKVFPGAVGSKGETKLSVHESTRKSVKGLGGFDQEHWQKDLSAALGLSATLQDIVTQIFVPNSTDTLEVNCSTSHGDWWHTIKEAEHDFASTTVLHQNKSTDPTIDPSDRHSGGHFQVHSVQHIHFTLIWLAKTKQQLCTPSRIDSSSIGRDNKTAPISKQETSLDELETDSGHESTTTDEMDRNLKPPEAKFLPSTGTPAGLGTSVVRSRLSPKPSTSLRKVNRSEIDGFVPQSPLEASRESSEPEGKRGFGSEHPLIERPKLTDTIQKPKAKLGRIGGKLNRNSRNELGDCPVEGGSTISGDVSQDIEDSQHPKDIVSSPRRGRAIVQPASPVATREASQERANNKREQLKRNLENKSSSTVKRKRKF